MADTATGMFKAMEEAADAQDYAEYLDDPQEWFVRGFSRGWSARGAAGALLIEDPGGFRENLAMLIDDYAGRLAAESMGLGDCDETAESVVDEALAAVREGET